MGFNPLMGHSMLQLLSTALGGDSGVVKHSGMIGIVGALILALLVSFLSSTVFMGKKKLKERGVLVEAGGEEGITMRHAGSPELVQVPWEGATTMAALFEQCCQKHSNLRFLGSRKLIERAFVQGSDGRKLEKLHLGEYEWKSYGETFDRASNFASGLVKLGHKLDTRAAIFSDTREEFFIAMQGCFRQNLTVVTVYASLGEDALVHSLNETQASTLICDSKLLEKLVRVGARLEAIQNVIYFEDDATRSGSAVPRSMSNWTVVSFGEVQNLGELNRHQPNLPSKNDVAMVMYTSGSTGLPKGVMITHGNIVATVAGVLRACPSNLDNEVYLAYLPMAHVLELISQTVMFAVGGAIGYGSALTLTDTSPKIKQGTRGDAAELKPTVMTAVPAILDRVRRGVMKKVEEKGGLASKLFNIAYRRQLAALDGSWFGAWALEKMFWDAIIFKGIRSVLGGRVWYLICGGAPLSGDTHRFINICMGAHVTTAYGLTETFAGATYSEWDEMTVGHVGPPVACSYIKLVSWKEGGYMTSDKPMPRGEIVVGGFSVSLGYFNNEEKTNEVYKVDERGMHWFYTGDIGQFHPDGTVEIIDRKKDIVKLQHGEYVSLGKVEAALKSSDYVDNIMVYADPFYSYSVALVVASHQDLQKWAEGAGVNSKDISELCNSDEAAQEVQQSLIEAAKNAKLGKFEIPAKLRLLADPWTPESGLVTNALKIKREQLKIKFKDELQRLYA